ncbi:glycosyltransferase family 4 protein [Fodinicola acaciae]|uniref:glycosyltransferase family 4 protein n=1 Tax=Fodinicola acaciae TaxID=2681555 RepID=UPI0013D60C32|nr:glycosyltransferase family 4 protein [Fodinicola acaciae]
MTVLVANPSTDLYGADRMALETVAALRENGVDVVVTTPVAGPLREKLAELGVPVVVRPVPVLRRGCLSATGILRILWETLVALPSCVRLARRSDVVYVNTVTIPSWIIAARLARRPVVAHVHELEASAGRIVRAGLVKPLLLARHVIANSAATKEFLARSGCRSRLVYNGVAEPPRPIAEISTTAPDPVRLGYVGRLSHRKGTDVAIDAVALLAERGIPARLDIIGSVFPGNEAFEAELRARARDLDVTFGGFSNDVWSAYERADIVLVPSRLEPFGLVAVEAQLAGRPVLSSDAEGLVEAVAAGETGVAVPAGNAAALADAVVRLLKDWPRAVQFAQRGKERAIAMFSPAGYRRAIVDLLTEASKR